MMQVDVCVDATLSKQVDATQVMFFWPNNALIRGVLWSFLSAECKQNPSCLHSTSLTKIYYLYPQGIKTC